MSKKLAKIIAKKKRGRHPRPLDHTSETQTLQIQQKREVLFVTPSGRQTSRERKSIPCVEVK